MQTWYPFITMAHQNQGIRIGNLPFETKVEFVLPTWKVDMYVPHNELKAFSIAKLSWSDTPPNL